MARVELIKTVRGLDQSGPWDNGENLNKLWISLTACANDQFHAAEESSLRWLLKSMNGSSPAAETLRRYPLTWRILACVFQRIPLFSLAKSLADRRFLSVLQQALKETSRPDLESAPQGSTKRKRSSSGSFSLDQVRSMAGSIECVQAIFGALGCLCNRMEETMTASAHETIGAEHLKSLFGSPAKEATAVVAPLLCACNLLLQSGQIDEVEGCESWVRIATFVWDLHLQGDADAFEVAQHLFEPSVSALVGLEGLSGSERTTCPDSLRDQWSMDLQTLMHRGLILPARSSYLKRQNDRVIATALSAAEQYIDAAAPALYFLASTATESMTAHGIRKGNAEWMKRVFKIVDESISEREDRVSIMKNVLQHARQRSMPVDTRDLRSVCNRYAFSADITDWSVVANLAHCDPDVFQGGEDGIALLKDVCARSLGEMGEQRDYEAVCEVIEAIARGFRAAREFPAFLRLWLQQLCETEQRKSKLPSPWYSVGKGDGKTTFSGSWVEDELSTSQLVELLDWAAALKKPPKPLYLWLTAISQGVTRDEFRDVVGEKLPELVHDKVKLSSDTAALRWRIVGLAFAWAPISRKGEIWNGVEDALSRTLKKSSVQSPETFEAFKCCCRMWVSLYPDGDQEAKTAKLVEKFTARLAAEAIAANVGIHERIFADPTSDNDGDILEHVTLQRYVAWYLRGSSRLNRLYFGKTEALSPVVESSISGPKASSSELGTLWVSLLDNEHCINESKMVVRLVDRMISGLQESRNEKHWPAEQGQLWIRLLSSTPLDTITRTQRECIMGILMSAFASRKSSKRSPLDGTKLVLSLATKLMARPTFYENMKFSSLVDVADAILEAVTSGARDVEVLAELVGRYALMVTATIKQMAEHMEERSVAYFTEASDFVSRNKEVQGADVISPLQLTLLKILAIEVGRSPSCRGHSQLASLSTEAQVALNTRIACIVGEWVENRKLFSNSTTATDMRLLAAVDASQSLNELTTLHQHKGSSLRKLEKRSMEAMQAGDLRGWKVQTVLQRFASLELDVPRPASFHSVQSLEGRTRERVLGDYVSAIVRGMSPLVQLQYLESLVEEYHGGNKTDGQLIATHYVVDQLIDSTDLPITTTEFDLSTAHSEMTRALATTTEPENLAYICRTLHSLLEKKPQAISQWNVESLLSVVAVLSSQSRQEMSASFFWLCKLVEVIVKKHRLRLEGHYHVLLAAMQPLLRNLIHNQQEGPDSDGVSQQSKASAFGRLITLVCEPTAGAVSRSQHHSGLDSATDTAKRSAGRHAYLILMQYVKLQLETDVSRGVREALEPAMNSIFDITPPEGRKILNDAMDASGRSILREMFKRYTRFGKWSGV